MEEDPGIKLHPPINVGARGAGQCVTWRKPGSCCAPAHVANIERRISLNDPPVGVAVCSSFKILVPWIMLQLFSRLCGCQTCLGAFQAPRDIFEITSASGAAGADEIGRARSLLNNAVSRQPARFVAASLEGAGNAREKNRKTFFDARLGARGCGLDPPRARRALQARHALDAGGDRGGRGGGAGGLCPSHARRARRSRRLGEAGGRGGRGLYPSHVRTAWQALQLHDPGATPGPGRARLASSLTHTHTHTHTPEAFNAVQLAELTTGGGEVNM